MTFKLQDKVRVINHWATLALGLSLPDLSVLQGTFVICYLRVSGQTHK